MNPSHTKTSLVYLYKIVEAGELGYAVVASNARNRALKFLFQSYSQQRRQFKDEIWNELQKMGLENKPKSSVLGMIHRGRIDIFSHFTIGDENVEKVLFKEVLIGENAAIKAYERTLHQGLPAEIRTMVERQFQEVQTVVEQVRLLRSQNGKRLLMRLYDSRQDAEQAFQSLKREGISTETIKIENFKPTPVEPYSSLRGKATAIFETILSGIVGAEIWGVVAAILTAISIIGIAGFDHQVASPLVIVESVLGLLAGAAWIGAVIGFFIGWGVVSQDDYVSETIKDSTILMKAMIAEKQASRAWQIMNQVALAAKAQHASESPA